MDVNRRALAIIGLVFVVLFVIQGVIILTRSSVSYEVTHVRVHPIGLDVCPSQRVCAQPSPLMRRYMVTFIVDERGTTSRPACTVRIRAKSESVDVRAVMVAAPGRSQVLWLGSADVEGPVTGLSPHVVKIECG